MAESGKAGKVFDWETVRQILGESVRTGAASPGPASWWCSSSLVWIRPATIREAVDVHIAAGDMQGLLRVFLGGGGVAGRGLGAVQGHVFGELGGTR